MFMEKITKILLRTYVYLTPSFLTINVFHCHFTFLSIDEPILIKYYLNLYFLQVSSVSINVLYLNPYRSPYYIQSSCLPMLALVATISQTFFSFFITLTVLKIFCKVFCRVPLHLGYSNVFLISRLGLWIWGTKVPLLLQISGTFWQI